MIEIEIPKDINKYEAKLIGPFTSRQTACFVGACALAIPAFLGLKEILPRDFATFVIMIICIPFVLIGWVKPYGMTFEQFARTAFISNVLSPKKRKYITMNNFECLNNPNFSYSDVAKVITKQDVKKRRKEENAKIETEIKYYI